jgi:hypothetical protein
LTGVPKGPRRLVISFGASSLTHYGGVYVLHRFLTRIGFKNALASDIRLDRRNNRYSVGEMSSVSEMAIFHAGFRFN